ncbi:hypothetical protein ACOJUR_10240 [Alicyclobacillus tolerans]|uniref:hypothetical protein n=1 Tax=Alicyclobacillus tolerans TaxID=90970 RepID=UPI003B7B9549
MSSSDSALRGHPSIVRNYLLSNGYTILYTRPMARLKGYWDRVFFEEQYEVNFIVRKNGKVYAVHVTANELSNQPNQQDLMQQWFPIFVIFHVQSILLMNLHDESVIEIDFEIRKPIYVRQKQLLLNAGILFTGILIGIMLGFHSL